MTVRIHIVMSDILVHIIYIIDVDAVPGHDDETAGSFTEELDT